MVKVTVFYPNEPGKRFDVDYYCNKHMPLAQEKIGPALRRIEVEHGLTGPETGSSPPYIVVGHLYFDSLEDCHKAMADNPELPADMPNYTDIQPVMQISEVKL